MRSPRNQASRAAPMPSASRFGGHDAVNPELGTLDDFRAFVAACV